MLRINGTFEFSAISIKCAGLVSGPIFFPGCLQPDEKEKSSKISEVVMCTWARAIFFFCPSVLSQFFVTFHMRTRQNHTRLPISIRTSSCAHLIDCKLQRSEIFSRFLWRLISVFVRLSFWSVPSKTIIYIIIFFVLKERIGIAVNNFFSSLSQKSDHFFA